MQIARLGEDTRTEFEDIQLAFCTNAPGYSLKYHHHTRQINSWGNSLVVFVQHGAGRAVLNDQSSEFSVGDIVLIRPGMTLQSDQPLNALVFGIPESETFPDELPTFLRPDHDPAIVNQPGGCATELDSYRRILLTWQSNIGPYRFKSLNAHRVKINDSFTHYHPVDGGFDEFYLVQDTDENGRILISRETEMIEGPATIEREQIETLFEEYQLSKGDLVYIPRGTIHRGLGGVLAQVITVPGFIPGAEIGVDHHLRAINDRFGLNQESVLPFNAEASHAPVIK